MDYKRAYEVLERTAAEQRLPVEQVIKQIEESIDEGIKAAKETNNEAALARWRSIPCVGEKPTAVELVAYVGELINGRQNPRK